MINATSMIKAFAVKDEYADSPVNSQQVTKTIEQKDIQFATEWNADFSDAEPGVINNLLRGSLDHTEGEWLGFAQNDLEATVDLGEIIPVKKISIGFLKNVYESIFVPDSVIFSISKDSESFETIGIVKYRISPFEQRIYVKDYVLENIDNVARFIKIEAKNMGICPHPHFNSGGKAWLYADEIIIN